MYDMVFIDEVQDLCGYDLEILDSLIDSRVSLEMVGDIRQAIVVTNERERMNSRYKYMGIWSWFLERERSGRLTIVQNSTTWRCRQEIANFADSLFSTSWGFNPTVSANTVSTTHDSIFAIKTQDIGAYLDKYQPLFLRQTAASGRALPFTFMNIGLSKGLTRKRILVLPTQPFKDFLIHQTPLTDKQASMLYVAATRAEQSVAFVLDEAAIESSGLRVWSPEG